MSSDINSNLEIAERLLKAVPEIYEDGLKSPVKESSKTLSLFPRTINAALFPLQKWILQKEYNLAEIELLLQEKLKNVNPKNIVTPEPYVAVPALNSISYCMNCDELRNLYANLLAKSMDVTTKDFVHPAFTEIIKQLSPLDAQIISEYIIKYGSAPIGCLRFEKQLKTPSLGLYKGATGFMLAEHIIYCENISSKADFISASLQNLHRLGIVEINYTKKLNDKSLYDKIRNCEFVRGLTEYANSTLLSVEDYSDYTIAFIEGCIDVTPLGKSFIETCCD